MLNFGSFFKKIKYYLTVYWYVFVGIILLILSIFFFWRKNVINELLQTIIESRKKQLFEIERLHEEERKKKEELQERYDYIIDQLTKKYAEENVNLERAKEKRVKEIVKEYGNDAEKLNEILKKEFNL